MIPAIVRDFVKSLPAPSALTGCRTGMQPFQCCEYDVVVFGQGSNSIVRVGDHLVELIYVEKGRTSDLIDLQVIKDSKSFSLSSRSKEMTPEKRSRALRAFGRKAIVSSLMYQQRTKDAKQTLTASMWLKAGAYQFVKGVIAITGMRPMPVHELAQVRHATLAGFEEGIQVALECIGIERATRPTIARSVKAISELKGSEYDAELVQHKTDWLLEKSMLADCYYFLGRVGCDILTSKNGSFHSRYGKLIQLALDLSADQQELEKLQKLLSRWTKKTLV